VIINRHAPNKINNIFNLSPKDRYDYFIRKVVDFGKVWLIKSKGMYVALGDNAGNRIIPVWPEKEFAQLLLTDNWKGFEVEQKSLTDFMEWLGQLQRGNLILAVFPKADFKTVVLMAEEIKERLLEALEQYE
jgi:hypothetical protein